jgi:hypothetical protein
LAPPRWPTDYRVRGAADQAPRGAAGRIRYRRTLPQNSNGGRHRCRPPLSLRGDRQAGKARRPHRAASKDRFTRKPGVPLPSSPSGVRNRSSRSHPVSPAGSPTGPKPWRFAARRRHDPEGPTFPPFASPPPKQRFRVRRDPGSKPWFRLGRCANRSSIHLPVDAFRETGVPLPASNRASGPRSFRPARSVLRAEALFRTVGASRSLPSASAWASPCFRIAAASSAAPPLRHRLIVWWDKRPVSLGPWLGRLSSVAGRSSLPRRKAVTKNESHQGPCGCG